MRSSLVLITLAAGAAAETTPLTCPTAEIPPASVHKSIVAARFGTTQWRGGVGLSPLDSLVDFVHRKYPQESCPYNMEPCCPAGQADCPVDSCGETHVCLPICCVLCDPCQYCYACQQEKCEAAGLDLTIGGERCPASRRLGARLPLFGHSYEEPDACPPIPSGCPRDIASVDDDTCEEEDLEAMTACRDMTGPGFCVDTGNTCYGGADAGIRTDCSAPNYDAVYRVVGIDPAADGCCHPVG